VTGKPSQARRPLPPQWGRWQPGAAIRLKALTPEEAWVVAAVLEDLLIAICRFHGFSMADYQGAMFPDWNPEQAADPHDLAPRVTEKDRDPDF